MKAGSPPDFKKEEDALLEAKKTFLGLFEQINQRYIAEMRNNPDVEADFTYSEFSMQRDCIRMEKNNKKYPLRDILEVV